MKPDNHKHQPGFLGKTLSLVAVLIIIASCSKEASAVKAENLPPGNATRGATLFVESINGSPPCSDCHAYRSTFAGPALTDYRDEAASRTDQTAFEYTLDSIVQPARHVLRGYSNTMYSRYGEKLSAQDIADLIAYMLD